ncbi:MAG: flagellar biosynthesis repressor FlbT [Alphaproteobacteria bacterium]|jgi:flagellar protein FlbT|nr:flagellar biosynthesis repressor FlbT [Alphaproteobacteria bacterium]
MSLKIVLKPDEKIIINQAVIINGKTKTEFIVENKSAILRKKDILKEEDAITPCKGLYYLLQMAYLFPESEDINLNLAYQLIEDIKVAAPSLSAQILHISLTLNEKNFYKALKDCQKLISVEEEILKNVC